MSGSSNVYVSSAALLLVLVCGCDQKVDKGDDKLTEGNQSVEVVYYDATETVLFDNLETLYLFNDSPVVALDDVVLGSGLILDTAGLWFNFVGTDGYSPLANGNCINEFAPTPADVIDSGYLERGTRHLLWDEAFEVPSCVSVKDVETIYVADNPEDLPVGGDADSDADSDSDSDADTDTDTDTDSAIVTIDFNGETEDVVFGGLATSDIGGAQVVLLTTIFGETSFSFDLADVLLSIEGSDGYNPVDQGTCTENLPAPGTTASQSGLDPFTNDIEWDPALDFAGCAFVKEVAIIYVLED